MDNPNKTTALLTLLFLVSLPYLVCSQDTYYQQADSFRNIWYDKSRKIPDSTRLEAGKTLIKIYSKVTRDSLLDIGRDMVNYRAAQNDDKWKTNGWNAIGQYYLFKGNTDSAALAYHTSLSYSTSEGDPERMIACAKLGFLKCIINQLDSGIYYLNLAFDLTLRYKHPESNLDKVLSNLSSCYQNKGDLVTALRYEYEAIKYGDDNSKSVSAFNIGTILMRVGLGEEAKESFELCFRLTQHARTPSEKMTSYLALLKARPHPDSMLNYLVPAFRMADSLGLKQDKIELMVNAVINFIKAGALQPAEKYIEESLQLLKTINMPSYKDDILLQKAKLKYIQHKYRESFLICKSIQPSFEQYDNKDMLAVLYELLSNNYQAFGRYDSAFYYLQKKEQAANQINSPQFAREVIRGYLKYMAEQEKKQMEAALENARQIGLLNAQKAKISYWLFGIITLFLLSIALFYYYIYTQKKKSAAQLTLVNNALEKEQEQLHRSNEQLIRFNQVVSHDILSNLDLVLSTGNVLLGSQKRSEQSLSEYYNMSQQTLRHLKKYSIDLLNSTSNNETPISLFDPMPSINEVLEQFDAVIKEKEATVTLETLPPSPLPAVQVTHIFQNLISNFIRYAAGKSHASLFIGPGKNEKNQVQWVIEDNGTGISTAQWQQIQNAGQTASSKGQGQGLGLMLQTLRSYGAHLDLETPDHGGARFVITYTKEKNEWALLEKGVNAG